MKNPSAQELSAFYAYQARKEAKPKDTKKTKKVVKKNMDAVFKVALFIVLISITTFFVTGCSYHAGCDQTKNGRGNIPVECRSLMFPAE